MRTDADVRLRRWIVVSLLALFALSIIVNVAQNPLDSDNTQIDEQGHLSYAYDLIQHDRWWPDFAHFPIYERESGRELTTPNYINHPPTFYWLAKLAHRAVPSLTGSDYRYGALAITLLSVALYGFLALRFAMPLVPTVIYCVMPWLIYMHKQMGFYNNDCLAIFGGLLATYGSLRWFARDRPTRAFWLLIGGLVLASVKLTALLLIGFYVAACLLLARDLGRTIRWPHWVIAGLMLGICALPYLHFLLQDGSIAPETLGQQWLMTHHGPGANWSRVLILGWVQEPRMDFLPWLGSFLHDFAVQVSAGDTTFLPLLLLVIAVLRGMLQPSPTPATPRSDMLRAGLIATAITLSIHAWFAWGRYQQYGWRLDSGLRYYYPLFAVYGAACGNVLIGRSRPRMEVL